MSPAVKALADAIVAALDDLDYCEDAIQATDGDDSGKIVVGDWLMRIDGTLNLTQLARLLAGA